MVDAAHGQPDQVVAIPDEAQFLRVAGDAGDGSGLIAPVAVFAAEPGAVVVLSGSRVGTYMGGGKVLLERDDRDVR